jgi:hypothetical protein
MDKTKACRVSLRKPEEMKPLDLRERKILQWVFKVTDWRRWGGGGWMDGNTLAKNRDKWAALVNVVMERCLP